MPSRTRNTVGKGKKLEGRSMVKTLVKAIQDLKVDTQVRGSPRVPDIPRLFIKNAKIFTMNQTYTIGSVSPSSIANVAGAINFTLGATPLATGFATLFDAYRILQVTLRFVPLGTLPAGGGGYNPLLTVIDYDDSTALASLAQAQAYDSCQETPLGNYCERTFSPRIAIAAYAGVFTSFANQISWIDVASNAVQHYGLKYWISIVTTTYTNLYTVEADVVMQFKWVR